MDTFTGFTSIDALYIYPHLKKTANGIITEGPWVTVNCLVSFVSSWHFTGYSVLYAHVLYILCCTDLILTYTDVCIALYTQCFPSVCGENFTGDSGGIGTHDLLLTSADVLTSRPPSLPDDDWLASIPYSSGFHDIYRLMKFLRWVINNWFNVL